MDATSAHPVTVDQLRSLATTKPRRHLFSYVTTLIDTENGVIAVPRRVVPATLVGQTTLTYCRLLYDRSQFNEDGIEIGPEPATFDGSDLDDRLALIAAGINDD